MSSSNLRIGFVPEHFSTPLHFAQKHHSLPATLHPFPSGTGAMVSALHAGHIDLAVGLTEGWISSICKSLSAHQKPGFALVGTYVESPLRWAISIGSSRDDIRSVNDLQHNKVGVSRIGSGSYVMSYVLAQKHGWLDPSSPHPPFPVEVLDTFANLRDGVNNRAADFFMWEYFTSKRYFDNGEIKHVGDIYSPWASWMIVAADHLLYPHGKHAGQKVLSPALEDALVKINSGIQHFRENQDEAVEYISTKLDYSEEDAREWLKTVGFATDVRGVSADVVAEAMYILAQAGVVDPGREYELGDVVALLRGREGRLGKAEERELVDLEREHLRRHPPKV